MPIRDTTVIDNLSVPIDSSPLLVLLTTFLYEYQ